MTDDLVVELREAGLLVRRYGRRKSITLTWDTVVEVAIVAAKLGRQGNKLFPEPATPIVSQLNDFTLEHLETISPAKKAQTLPE